MFSYLRAVETVAVSCKSFDFVSVFNLVLTFLCNFKEKEKVISHEKAWRPL